MTRILLILLMIFLLQLNSQANVKLVYKGNNVKYINAVKRANEILESDEFYNEIRKIKTFDNTKLSGEEIAELLKNAKQTIKVVVSFKPIANASTKTSTVIKISSIKFSSILKIGVNTLIHETVHAVDLLDGKTDYTHNGNSPTGQENTAPWVIGAIAERMVK